MERVGSSVDLGKILVARRRSLGLRQQELADLANVSCRFLSSLENGKPSVELDKVFLVISTLGLDFQIGPR